jgi:polyhydroxyalkanoate synthase
MLTWMNATDTLSAQDWLKSAPLLEGSWWPAWQRWLAQHSSKKQERGRAVRSSAKSAAPLEDAPGRYVRE